MVPSREAQAHVFVASFEANGSVKGARLDNYAVVVDKDCEAGFSPLGGGAVVLSRSGTLRRSTAGDAYPGFRSSAVTEATAT